MTTIKTDYLPPQEAIVQIGCYSNSRTALRLISPTGEPLLTATVNLPEIPIQPNHVFIKDYSENLGVLTALQGANVIQVTGQKAVSGFTMVDICKLKPISEWKLPYQDERK